MEMQQVLLQIILVSLFSHIIVSYILYVKVLEKSMKVQSGLAMDLILCLLFLNQKSSQSM